MATPTPGGYTITYVSTVQQAIADAVNNLLDPINHYFYYMSDINWNKIDLVAKTVLASNAPATNSPGGGDNISVDPTGTIWFHQPDFPTPTLRHAVIKMNPSTFATIASFDMNTNWAFAVKSFGGHNVVPGVVAQWPTQDGKIVCMCTWSNSTPTNSKPAPFVGTFSSSTLTSIGTYDLVLPVGTPASYFLYQPPTGNYYVDTRPSSVQPIPILDELGNAYVLGVTSRQGTAIPIVYDWYIWKVNLTTMAGAPWHYVGDATVGQGTGMLYDAASNSLYVQSTTGKLFVVNCTTGAITNTVSGLFANGNLGIVGTQGKTVNGVFFTGQASGGGLLQDFILSSTLTSEGVFVNTSGVNWGGLGAGYAWVYDPILNYIVVPTGNNYPPVGGLTPATLIYQLVSTTLLTITVTPSNTRTTVGGTVQYTATGNYSDGSTQNLTSSVTWLSSSPANATISVGGLATGVSRGLTTISAVLGLVSGSTGLAVTGIFRNDGWVTAATGVSIPNAAVYVSNQPTSSLAIPPSNLASLFSDPNGISPLAQPVLTDALGHYDFYVLSGIYTITISINNQVSHVYPDQSIGRTGS